MKNPPLKSTPRIRGAWYSNAQAAACAYTMADERAVNELPDGFWTATFALTNQAGGLTGSLTSCAATPPAVQRTSGVSMAAIVRPCKCHMAISSRKCRAERRPS
jgi:hypothetical protein